MSDEERKAWARLVRAEHEAGYALGMGQTHPTDISAAEAEAADARGALRRLVPDVDDYLNPPPEHCGQCGAVIEGAHGYCSEFVDSEEQT